MKRIWLAIFFLSASWGFLSPLFLQDYRVGSAFAFLGCVFSSCVFAKRPGLHIDKRYGLIVLPLVLTSLWVGLPYGLAYLMIGAGVGLLAFKSRFGWRHSLGNGFVFSGLVFASQSAMLPLFSRWAARYYDLSLAAFPVCSILEFFGQECTFIQGTLAVQSIKEVLHFTIFSEELGIYSWLNLLLGTAITLLVFRTCRRAQTFVLVLFISSAYLVVRCAAVVMLYLHFETMKVFWSPWVTAGTFVPLIGLFVKLIRFKEPVAVPSFQLPALAVENRRSLVTIGCVLLVGVFFMVGAWGYQDAGVRKGGRILIDEKHSNWEWTGRTYDTKWYGIKSGYNYYCLAEYLNYFYALTKNHEEITRELLEGYDILFIKTPTSAFSKSEVDAVYDFVRGGGGLYLVGDHTNVFGTSTYINPLAQRFGLAFRHDSTHDLKTGDLSVYKPPPWLPHPIVQNFNSFLFGTSCSLQAPWSADDVILGYSLKSLSLDYSQKSFFNEKRETTEMDFGPFLQAAALKFGKGRVLAFTDSTVFSNYWMFVPGKPELLLGSIEWLNRMNFPVHLNPIFFITGFAFLIGGTLRSVKRFGFAQGIFFTVLFCLLVSMPVTAFFGSVNHKSYSLPQAHTKYTKVCFDLEHSDLFLPIVQLVGEPEKSFHTFYVWVQRLGYVPVGVPRLEEAIEAGDLVMIVNPVKHFTKKEIDQILKYVEKGGKVVMMDRNNEHSTANEILEHFGMKLNSGGLKGEIFRDPEGRPIATTHHGSRVEGGDAILVTENRGTVLSAARKGKGRLVVMADSMLFSDKMFGSTGTVPNSEQLKLYELEFWMLRNALGEH